MAAAWLGLGAIGPAHAQTTPKFKNGIHAAPQPGEPASNGIQMTPPQPSEAPSPLIVPLPPELTWGDVAKQDALQFSVIPRGRANILVAWGGVGTGDSSRFRDALDAARPIDEIWLESPGGDLDEGLEIGRLIHARKLATHIKRGFRCVSACNFMFMGGVVRYIDTGGSFEVHMFSDNEASQLRNDLVEPPKSYRSLLHKFPSMDADRLAGFMEKSYPEFQPNQDKIKKALSVVKQQNPDGFDDDQEGAIALVRQLVVDYNDEHPDSKIDEKLVIQKVVIDEDVKKIQMTSAQVAASIAMYLTEMGLSLKFLTRFADIHNDQPTALSRDELREFNVMNTD